MYNLLTNAAGELLPILDDGFVAAMVNSVFEYPSCQLTRVFYGIK